MNYTYEITKLDTTNEIIRIKYSATDKQDYYYSSVITAFDSSNVNLIVGSGANLAGAYWSRVDDHPDSADVPLTGSGTYTAPVDPVPTSIADQPSHDYYTQTITLSETPDSSGVLNWTVTDLSDEQKATNFRNQRDTLLEETDWMVLSDTPSADSDWLTYRQNLRDITSQSGFPNSVVWPTKPV